MERTWKPFAAGILNIITGALSLLGSLFIALMAYLFLVSPNWYWEGPVAYPAVVLWLVFLPYFIISSIAIISGVLTLRRKAWGLALAGSICSLFTIWGWALGVAAIVLVSMAKREFDDRKLAPI